MASSLPFSLSNSFPPSSSIFRTVSLVSLPRIAHHPIPVSALFPIDFNFLWESYRLVLLPLVLVIIIIIIIAHPFSPTARYLLSAHFASTKNSFHGVLSEPNFRFRYPLKGPGLERTRFREKKTRLKRKGKKKGGEK